MRLDWNKIISNAITILVATVFLGAAAKLWSGVESIDSRINSNLTSIRATQNVLAPKVDKIEEELRKIGDVLTRMENGDQPLDEDPKSLEVLPTKGTFDLINENYLEQATQTIVPNGRMR